MQIIKNLFKKSADPYLALLAYGTSPFKSGYSPAKLLKDRSLRNTVPASCTSLEPEGSFLHDFRKKGETNKAV